MALLSHFKYATNRCDASILSRARSEFSFKVNRIESKLREVEASLIPGDTFTTWHLETDALISALLTSNWKATSFEIPEHMSQLYFPNSNLLMFSKGNLKLVLGLMRISDSRDYAPALTIISA